MGERRSIFLTAIYILPPGSMLRPLGEVAVEAGATVAFLTPQHIPICHRIAASYLHCLARTNEATKRLHQRTNQLLEFTFSNDILIHSGISQLHSRKTFIRATPRPGTMPFDPHAARHRHRFPNPFSWREHPSLHLVPFR